VAGISIAGCPLVSKRKIAMRIWQAYLLMAAFSGMLMLLWLSWLPAQARLAAAQPQQFALSFYRYAIGPMDGRSCPSFPVCSVYAGQALEKHGLLIGSWLMLDRLIHEADDVQLGPVMKIHGQERVIDPLSRNDFWLGT